VSELLELEGNRRSANLFSNCIIDEPPPFLEELAFLLGHMRILSPDRLHSPVEEDDQVFAARSRLDLPKESVKFWPVGAALRPQKRRRRRENFTQRRPFSQPHTYNAGAKER